jgi:uncharacterized protein (TIGR03435 family)
MIRALPLFIICFGAPAQTVSTRLEFDAASVKPSAKSEPGRPIRVGCSGGPGTKDPGLFSCGNMNLPNLITIAYSLDFYRVAGFPEGMLGRFDITARVPDGATKDQFSVMLQNLLIDRFHLTVHHESREIAKYDLVIAKNGPKFREAPEPPPVDQDPPAAPPPGARRFTTDKAGFPVLAPGRAGMAMTNGRARMFEPRMSMKRLAAQVSAQMGKPVTDATGLAGEYEISMYWAAETLSVAKPDTADSPETGPTLVQALQEQLGLRLEQKKGSVDFLVVDHVDKIPEDN